MWLNYLKERNPELNVYECDKGFATYKYMNLGEYKAVYIEDIYVAPEYRNENVASKMSSIIRDIAKQEGCKYMLGTVCPSSNGSTDSLRVLLAHGMTLLKSEDNLIWFYKDLI
jgi:GNAT superfamily N-acetyltransferase